ncbi:MAG: 2-amino-4-hydroxy-6-hydroxymethyldihydropteridine diphosphokinase [Clostridiales bacterium]|nr:2-amino-4-hydroxy-6-hydroxymethyldihydropteridine diphosphokinase [Clostridiales bacterium]
MTDQIRIQNLEVYAYHGVFPEEAKLGQKFLVDAVLYTDLREAGFSDHISASVDYGFVCHFITEFMKENTFQLLESVAEHLAETLLLEIPKLDSLDLEIKNPWAPIALPLDTASVRISRGWHTVYLSVGSNLGDREAYIRSGLDALTADRHTRDVQISSLMETEPYGYTDQPSFLNAAIGLRTLYTPEELLELLHRVEAEAGRERGIHWGPRTLDLDILFYDDVTLEKKDFIVPHPDMENRLFVLKPLSELCPGRVHPVLRKTVLQMLRELSALSTFIDSDDRGADMSVYCGNQDN